MATDQSGSAESRRYVGRLVTYRNGDMTLFVPFLLDESTLNNNGSGDENDTRVVVLVSPSNRTYSVLQAVTNLDAFFVDFQSKAAGSPPASDASIEALPEVENEGSSDDCAICLEGMKVVKVMPCKHMFHGGCIEKWLRIHGSCPVCRYPMPADDKEEHKDDVNVNGSTRMRVIWVPVSVESINN